MVAVRLLPWAMGPLQEPLPEVGGPESGGLEVAPAVEVGMAPGRVYCLPFHAGFPLPCSHPAALEGAICPCHTGGPRAR